MGSPILIVPVGTHVHHLLLAVIGDLSSLCPDQAKLFEVCCHSSPQGFNTNNVNNPLKMFAVLLVESFKLLLLHF